MPISLPKSKLLITILLLVFSGAATVINAKTGRPFWTEKSSYIFADYLYVVGVGSNAEQEEAGRKLAFDNGKQEISNFVQITDLEDINIATQMTYTENLDNGRFNVFRLLKVDLRALEKLKTRQLERKKKELLEKQASSSELKGDNLATTLNEKPMRIHKLWLSAGPTFRHSDLGWDVGLNWRPIPQRWQAGLNVGGYRHYDHVYGADTSNDLSDFSTQYISSKMSVLFPFQHIRFLTGEPIMDLKGFLRLGAGFGLYHTKERFTHSIIYVVPDYKTSVSSHLKGAPSADVALIERLGYLEFEQRVEYVSYPGTYGVVDYNIGGLGYLFSISFPLW